MVSIEDLVFTIVGAQGVEEESNHAAVWVIGARKEKHPGSAVSVHGWSSKKQHGIGSGAGSRPLKGLRSPLQLLGRVISLRIVMRGKQVILS